MILELTPFRGLTEESKNTVTSDRVTSDEQEEKL